MMLRLYICHIHNQSHNLGTFYARKLKFDMLLTQTLTLHSMLELHPSLAVGWSYRLNLITFYIWYATLVITWVPFKLGS